MKVVKIKPSSLTLVKESNDNNVHKRFYLCPCGRGYIIVERDFTPGHRDTLIHINCNYCNEEYRIINPDSTTKWYIRTNDMGGDNMARRKPYSKVKKSNQIRADHVKGMGDVFFRGFQCLNPDCTNFIFVKNDEIGDDFKIVCPVCGFEHSAGAEISFYDYSMDVEDNDGNPVSVSKGAFKILHDNYIADSPLYKYCIVCNTLKPADHFDSHSARKTGLQGECRLCKQIYNYIKNSTRLTDQHRESAQNRRLLLDVAGSSKIDGKKVEERFKHKCFNCGDDLSNVTDPREKPLDHTLSVYYLWPYTTETATLLCRDCNGNKSGGWPSEFYNKRKLKELSIRTGIDYKLLSGPPQYNPKALAQLQDPHSVDELLEKHANNMNNVIKLRNRVLKDTGIDFFKYATKLSKTYIKQADDLLQKK